MKFGWREKARIKKDHIRQPVNRNPNFFTNWTFYWQIRFCKYYAFSLNQMSDIREVWKYWPLKDCFRSISQKFYRAAILWWMGQNISNFQQTFLLTAAFKVLHFRVYCYFCVLAIKLILMIFNEMKQKLWRPVISTIVYPYTSIFQMW